ncbi:MAG: hypothetical protein JKP95_01140 [Oceanicaulis sp.]|nr:hypothetical protein [Oceanicaulis sp.]
MTSANASAVTCPAAMTPLIRSRNCPNWREQVIDPVTSYQIVHMLEGAVQRGTATALRSLGRPLGGKTGTHQ